MLNKYLRDKGISLYQCAKDCGIPYSMIYNLANGKRDIFSFTINTADKLCRYFHIALDDLISICNDNTEPWSVFTSNVQHNLKNNGEKDFIKSTIEHGIVQKLWEHNNYAEALYYIGIIDTITSKYDMPYLDIYNRFRQYKLKNPKMQPDEYFHKHNNNKEFLPELLKFNIYERSLNDAV